jgi:uroporphyrinogen-III synthase
MASEPAIIVTRPNGQARHLTECIQAGAQVQACPVTLIGLPLLTIVPKNDEALPKKLLKSFSKANLIIFVSPNAIECAMRMIADAGSSWNELVHSQVVIGVVGSGSREALVRHGVDPRLIVQPPDGAQSDADGLWRALENPISNGQNWSAVVVKGEGGRESLMERLKTAGVMLETLSLYHRIPLDASSHLWSQLQKIDPPRTLWLLTSSEAVRHLGAVSARDTLFLTTCIQQGSALCSHPNIASTAQEIGFTKILISDPGDESIAKAALAWLAKQVKIVP